MVFHLLTYASWFLAGIFLIIARITGRSAGAREAQKLNRPVCRYEVLTIPAKANGFRRKLELTRSERLLATMAEKSSLYLCEGNNIDGYRVIIRNTVEGWRKKNGWESSYWLRFEDKSDVEVGFVATNDPDFHTKILLLQDEAAEKTAVLTSIA